MVLPVLTGWIGANVKLFEGLAFSGKNMSRRWIARGSTRSIDQLRGFGFLCSSGVFDIEAFVEQPSGVIDA